MVTCPSLMRRALNGRSEIRPLIPTTSSLFRPTKAQSCQCTRPLTRKRTNFPSWGPTSWAWTRPVWLRIRTASRPMSLGPREWASLLVGRSRSGMKWAPAARIQRGHRRCRKQQETCYPNQRARRIILALAPINGQLSRTGRWQCSFRTILSMEILLSIETP